MYPYCFFENKISKSNKPLVKINDIAILRGFAAFDFMRIYNSKLFMFDEHFERFSNTTKEMGIKIPYSKKKVKDILFELVKKNKDINYHVRFVLTGGETQKGINPGKPILYIIFEEMTDLPSSLYKKGAKLITHEYKRTLPSSKTSNYLKAVLLQNKKNKKGATEILYINNKEILECSTSNIFIVKNNKLITPKDNILKGITRATVIKLAKENNLTVVERVIKTRELKTADEIFITATNKKVLSIVKIDDMTIGSGKPGEVSRILNEAYNKLIA
jgi:D-amino acid aminotransferase